METEANREEKGEETEHGKRGNREREKRQKREEGSTSLSHQNQPTLNKFYDLGVKDPQTQLWVSFVHVPYLYRPMSQATKHKY